MKTEWSLFLRASPDTPILWPSDVKSWLIGKDPDAGKDWGQEEKGTTEDEMVGWHHRLNGREFEWTPEVGDEQGGLACCDSWGHKESDTTERLNRTEHCQEWSFLERSHITETHSGLFSFQASWPVVCVQSDPSFHFLLIKNPGKTQPLSFFGQNIRSRSNDLTLFPLSLWETSMQSSELIRKSLIAAGQAEKQKLKISLFCFF